MMQPERPTSLKPRALPRALCLLAFQTVNSYNLKEVSSNNPILTYRQAHYLLAFMNWLAMRDSMVCPSATRSSIFQSVR